MSAGRWPTFLVIGAYKSGTTAVHHALRAHPDVFVPDRKEPDFFAFVDAPDPANPAYAGAVRDEAAYTALFAAAGDARAVGEVSPEYLANPAAAPAIARRLPDATLLAVLRNPVERAWSDWLMYTRDGRERATFAAALADQERRRAAGDPTGSYLTTGEYARQLATVFAHVRREQVHVWLYDDLVTDPDRVLAEMFGVLGVDPAVAAAPAPRVNAGGVPRSRADRVLLATRERLRPVLRHAPLGALRGRLSGRLEERLERPAIDPEVRAALAARFRPEVERLQELLGRDLSAWLGAA